MGIKDLWTILTPFCERKPLYELQGKTVAIDLSCWICEAQNITDYTAQPRMYLRNLYFRTCFLLLMDVKPVFVLEGKAPNLKYDTIAARNQIQFKGARPRKDGCVKQMKNGKDRTRFHYTLNRCREMLENMGLVCVQGNGEAEAMCAYLNADGLVDGCVSQDSDCFAYGAKIVYRNFSISQQGAHAATGGAVDVYDISKANDQLKFGRNKIVALALLCGSDYSEGVHGVGKDSAVKFFNKITDEDILVRLRNWRLEESRYRHLESKINNKNICTSCGHDGKVQAHNKNGCKICQTTRNCSTSFKDERVEIKNELNIRSKALVDPNFPDENLINEFLQTKDNVESLNLNWNKPDMVAFVKFAVKYLTWEELYAFQKFLPILTRWQLFSNNCLNEIPGIIYPIRIKKRRNPKGVASYEIIWQDKNNYFKNLIPKEQLVEIDLEKLWSTVEPSSLVEKTYPELVETFEQSKRKKPASRRRKKISTDEINEMLQNVSISEPKPKQKRIVKKQPISAKPIDSYFKKAVLNCATSTPSKNNKCISSTPSKSDSCVLDCSNFGDEDDLDVSDAITDIISRQPPKYLTENLKKYGYVLSKSDETNERKLEPKSQIEETNGSFFMTSHCENDLFEKTIEERFQNIDDSSSDDSFDEVYVPLIERIRNK